MSSRATYFVAATISTASGSRPARAAAAAIRSRASVRPAMRRLPDGPWRCPSVGEEARVAHRADAGVVHLGDAGVEQAPAGDRGEVDLAAAARLGDVRERFADLVAHLVAAAPRPRADRREDRPGAAELAQRGEALVEDPGGEAAPAGVDHGHGALRVEGDGQAVGGENEAGDAAEVRRDTVRLRPHSVRRLGLAHDVAAVDLRAAGDGNADRLAQPSRDPRRRGGRASAT